MNTENARKLAEKISADKRVYAALFEHDRAQSLAEAVLVLCEQVKRQDLAFNELQRLFDFHYADSNRRGDELNAVRNFLRDVAPYLMKLPRHLDERYGRALNGKLAAAGVVREGAE